MYDDTKGREMLSAKPMKTIQQAILAGVGLRSTQNAINGRFISSAPYHNVHRGRSVQLNVYRYHRL